MMDQLLLSLKEVCETLLPIVGVIALVYLALFLRKLIQTMNHAITLIDDINDKVSRLEHPIATVNDLCGTIDGVHKATVDGVNGFFDYIVKNYKSIASWFKEIIDSRKHNDLDIQFENTKDDEKIVPSEGE